MRAVSFRLPEDKVIAYKLAAARANLSFTAWIIGAADARLTASILDEEMVPRETPDVTRPWETQCG